MALTRRQVILTGLAAGGGLLVAVGLRPNQDVRRASERIAGADEHLLTTFLRIGEDDTLTVIVTHCEMGQGVYTALPMLAAEELGSGSERRAAPDAAFHTYLTKDPLA